MIKVDAKVRVPVFGRIPAEILINTATGKLQLYVEMLRMCQEEDIPQFNLKELLLTIYSEQGGLTTYDGDHQPVWDTVTYDKFHMDMEGEDHKASVSAWVDKTTHNGRWLELVTDLKLIPDIVINVPKGEEPATFTDADFTLEGCAGKTFERDPSKMVRLFRQ